MSSTSLRRSPRFQQKSKKEDKGTTSISTTKRKAPAASKNKTHHDAKKQKDNDVEVVVNRSPVLILWTAVVAHTEGYSWDASLSIGKAFAAMCAQAKGRHIGIIKGKDTSSATQATEGEKDESFKIDVFHTKIWATRIGGGGDIRAVQSNGPIDTTHVLRYLQDNFGDTLPAFRNAFSDLVGTLRSAYGEKDYTKHAFEMYEKFRPTVPQGRRGWGHKSSLHVSTIEELREDLHTHEKHQTAIEDFAKQSSSSSSSSLSSAGSAAH
eukprot:TRINITY_DN10886_c0_g1_i1.p1 TRINITY_DN10886_c0_g1~~TRINITY_DN10886_c0_g1_i1.p1  ORF type:complete len:266 (+),score=66.05 TRINITY_DN10886_c0_g1_i1:586-1383(+)